MQSYLNALVRLARYGALTTDMDPAARAQVAADEDALAFWREHEVRRRHFDAIGVGQNNRRLPFRPYDPSSTRAEQQPHAPIVQDGRDGLQHNALRPEEPTL